MKCGGAVSVSSNTDRTSSLQPLEQQHGVVPDRDAEFRLFDRVVNVREDFSVPVGLRGTVIGIKGGNATMFTCSAYQGSHFWHLRWGRSTLLFLPAFSFSGALLFCFVQSYGNWWKERLEGRHSYSSFERNKFHYAEWPKALLLYPYMSHRQGMERVICHSYPLTFSQVPVPTAGNLGRKWILLTQNSTFKIELVGRKKCQGNPGDAKNGVPSTAQLSAGHGQSHTCPCSGLAQLTCTCSRIL